MKILKGSLLFILAFAHFSFSGKEKCTVSFNGIYTASVDAETDAHIRFYEDGTVIASTSVKNIKDVNKWFTKENIERVLKGKYKIKISQYMRQNPLLDVISAGFAIEKNK